ncbi:MAG TPA: DUF971 domain-containing protein [Cycloclasticus sp.]|jgi:DUF971 family protein|nr:DUF971 domain-containing protein [Cycloclasticus sp.]HIL93091.1 DUF971 domain-containing protein [Cycloclasticus sp.]
MTAITDLALDQKSRVLSLSLDDGQTIELSCEYLRVHSPSAEVRGHGPGQEVLQLNKEDVNITAIEPVGNYAVRLVFSDGHDTGLYAWDFLVELAEKKDENWQHYLARLEEAGHQRTFN